jgi:hypothetical protein
MIENGRSWKLLLTFCAAATLLLSCIPQNGSPTATQMTTQASFQPASTSLPTGDSAPAATPTTHLSENLDLREANVLNVVFEDLGDGRYRFEVTLLHDDDGEAPSYADTWQVWDTAGNLLGERVLTHSHGTSPFTRSATIEIPAGVGTVLIRGHDMEHGHGGQSMRVDLESGEMETYIEEIGD